MIHEQQPAKEHKQRSKNDTKNEQTHPSKISPGSVKIQLSKKAK